MRRREVVFLESAQADLSEIFQHVLDRTRSRAVALRYVDRSIDAGERIGDAAEAGRLRDDLVPGLRTWSFERKAVLASHVRDGFVEITNVFAKGRDLSGFFGRSRLETRDIP